jgi:hypothetical protein
MLIIGTKAHGCSLYLKKRGFVRNIYLAAESQANLMLAFVEFAVSKTYKAYIRCRHNIIIVDQISFQVVSRNFLNTSKYSVQRIITVVIELMLRQAQQNSPRTAIMCKYSLKLVLRKILLLSYN